jgi:hypothetical protein
MNAMSINFDHNINLVYKQHFTILQWKLTIVFPFLFNYDFAFCDIASTMLFRCCYAFSCVFVPCCIAIQRY